jgi:peptide/nickel transport system substrate-binding protein
MGLRSLLCSVAAGALMLGLAACDTSSTGGSSNGKGAATSMTIDMGYGGTTIARDFNPYSPDAVIGTDGYTYETLFGFDLADSSKFVPWLADSIDWADGGKQLTIHLDPRANWSDGSPLTSADVVFTFQDTTKAGLQTVTYQSIYAEGPHTVVMTFGQPAYTQLDAIAQQFIIPEKIWSHENIKTWTNPEPVASGPYTLKSYSPQELIWAARSGYWKGDVAVKTLYAPIISQATGVLPLLNSGQVQWSGGAISNVIKGYVDKDPSTSHAWYPSYGALFLYPNLRKAPFNNVNVREGISLAIDREQLSQIVDDGLSYPIDLSGMDQKTQTSWISPSLAGDIQNGAEDTQALAAFTKAGYTLKGGKLVNATGTQLSFTITEVSTFATSIERDQLICQQLSAVGVKCTVASVPSATQLQDAQDGDFDMLSGGVVYGVTPYDFYSQVLYGKYIGSGSEKNYEGLNNASVNQTLTEMTETGNETTLHELSAQLEQYVAANYPVIALVDIGASSEYSTSEWTGWPSASDPYALPAPWAGPPDEENVLLHLRPVG